MTPYIWVNTGFGKGLSDGTKRLPELILTYHQYDPGTFIWGNATSDVSATNL